MSKTCAFIKYEKGVDGGFGDYCSPDWSYAPTLKDKDGNPIWFDDAEAAKAFASRCNKLSEEAFYSQGHHDEYDGDFPVEYQVISFEVPDNQPVSQPDAVFDSIKENVEKVAVMQSVYDDFDDYEW